MTAEAFPVLNTSVVENTGIGALSERVRDFTNAAFLNAGVAVGAVCLLASGCSGGAEKPAGAQTQTIEAIVKDACPQGVLTPESNNPDKYVGTGFLPKADKPVTSKDTVSDRITSFFDKDGPLGHSIDTASLAAVTAVIVAPAHDGAEVNPAYDYVKAYGDAAAKYSAPEGGLNAARKDCEAAAKTLVQTADFDPNFAQAGETVTRFEPIRDTENTDPARKNDIKGFKLEKVVIEQTLNGVAFEKRPTSKEIDGFTRVLLTDEGVMYVKGVTVGEGGSASGASTNNGTETTKANGKGSGTNANGGGSQGANPGPGQGNANTGGAAGPNGTNPEAGPGGVTNSPGGGGNPNNAPAPATPNTAPHDTAPQPTTATTSRSTVTTAPPQTAPPQTTGTTAPPRTTPPPTTPPRTTPSPTTPPPTTPPPTKGPVPTCTPSVYTPC